MRSTPDAICWYEGMHLLPQHFQLQDLRAQSLSARLTEHSRPWYWGVQQLQIDQLALSNGTLRISALNAVMPDGLVVEFNPERDRDFVPQLTITPKDFEDQRSLIVYLAVDPLWRSGQLVPLNGRLRSDNAQPVLDLSSGEHPETVSVWRPNLRLVLAAGRSDSVCLPLLRLGCEDNVISQLPYTPPTPLLTAQSPIGSRIASLCEQVRQKGEALTRRWIQLQEAGKGNDSAELHMYKRADLRMQINALWSRLPELQANLETGVATPVSLYLQLTGMAGAIASLQPELGVRSFAALNFEDLQAGFDPVLDWLESRLSSISAGYQRRSFELRERLFLIGLQDTRSTQQALIIGLRMPSGSTPQAARGWLEQAIISSRPHLPALSRQRMRGLEFGSLERDELIACGAGEDIRLFKIHASGQWFTPDSELCLYVPPGSGWVEPAEIVMFDMSRPD
ncbi:type VI secretion system baseplate subunit TssK [Pseudomonas sp. LJDD11]|uniref:type VI secretion system baseplate subunit TssK n=1 Tax=Pseudomonas sp. LJDD11 TaxID=2931984 RepID=UPI00211B7437|nr:type VI secretion system baseplate subunit TssK [Pseudomonas sp. LJDD11]MCQ9422893.1 type VI secretion system baseplate subunit TssK [Pseudomonas sp. LJDD11]